MNRISDTYRGPAYGQLREVWSLPSCFVVIAAERARILMYQPNTTIPREEGIAAVRLECKCRKEK